MRVRTSYATSTLSYSGRKRIGAEVAAHRLRVGLLEDPAEPADPRDGVVPGVVRDGELAAGAEDPGDLGQREPRGEPVQGGGRGDDVEVAGQEGQRLDPAGDVQPAAEPVGQARHPVHGAVEAEDLVPGSLQHHRKTTAARAQVQDAHGVDRRIYLTIGCDEALSLLGSSPLAPAVTGLGQLFAAGGPFAGAC